MKMFNSNLAKILSGNFLSQILLVVTTPYLTRIFTPEDFGEFALFSAFFVFLANFSTLKYENSFLIEKNSNLFLISIRAIMLHALLYCSVILVFILVLAHFGFIKWHFFLMPFCVFFASLWAIGRNISARNNNYRFWGLSYFLSTLINILGVLILYRIGVDSSFALCFGLLLGSFFGAVTVNFLGNYDEIKKSFAQKWSSRKIIFFLLKHKKFPFWNLPTSLILNISSYMPVFCIGMFFSMKDLGDYSVASKFAFLPSVMIGGAVAEVFKSKIGEKYRIGEDVRAYSKKYIFKLFVIAFPFFVLIAFFSENIFNIVLGEQYSGASSIAASLFFAALGYLLFQVLSSFFIVGNELRLGLLMQIAFALIPLLSLWISNFCTVFSNSIIVYSFTVLFVSIICCLISLNLKFK